MNVAFHTAVSGMLTAQSHLADAARDTVTAVQSGQDIIQPVIAVKQAEATHAASAMVARAASDMTDSLLDILA